MSKFVRGAAVAGAAACLLASLASPAWAQDKTSIEWWYANGGRVEEGIQKIIADFNASQDKYEVVGIKKGNYEETFAAMIAAYRVGQHPSIIQSSERTFLTMIDSNAIVPVSELMTQQGYTVDWANFVKPVADFYLVGDTPAAMPFNSSTAVMWYNADHFKAAGFDGPAATWPEFEKQLYAIKEKGISECAMALNSDFYWSLIEGYSSINDYPFGTKGNGFEGLDTEYVYNTTPVVQQVERLKKWIDDGVIQLAGQGLSPMQLYTSGTCSTISASTAGHADVEANAKFNWSAAFQPHEEGVEPHNSNIGGAALWVLKGKTDAENAAAAAFLNFIAQPDTQAWWSEWTGYVPVTNAAYEKMKAAGFFEKHPTREIAIKQLSQGTPTVNSRGFRFGNSNQTSAILVEEIQAAWTGQKTVQQALDAAVSRGNEVLRQYEQLHAAQ
ncbi:ABC transporter substrate-binding protein [Youhaiella tibetensis]|uniref:sn-glycerol-3-phosphate-binding periplasmic protein UgpB n=1 Tax=Paradevosia tibetensis TaxID=1447062 RepID=A0A5B9DMF9_9HYPH|nr:extracellular solute-binding protein [Youhaiella tibetensis]AKR55084.1 ABC transporter substrate-binding protein [Devosia sp. H5989]QEE20186.1 extracellular solute-binding protein [Youhaiella tibetensis]GGF26381.1 ABC transporter substrate-binding protein [Youhaiella tibetensis]